MSWPMESSTSSRFSRTSTVAAGVAGGRALASGRSSSGKSRLKLVRVPRWKRPCTLAEMILRASDRIGRGHDGDVAEDAALGLGRAQLRHQRVDGDDAGQFAGMERRLDIGGRRLLRRALEAEHGEFVGHALGVARQFFDRRFHAVLLCRRGPCLVAGAGGNGAVFRSRAASRPYSNTSAPTPVASQTASAPARAGGRRPPFGWRRVPEEPRRSAGASDAFHHCHASFPIWPLTLRQAQGGEDGRPFGRSSF